MDQITSTIIGAAVPTFAIIFAVMRNQTALAALGARISILESSLSTRISNLETRLDARMETLDRDLREWAKIAMQINTDVARLKDKVRLDC